MADRPKFPPSNSKPHSDHAAGTYSKNSKGAQTEAGAAAAQHENRFAEVQRKSREARDRMNAASQARAERRDIVDRDRDCVQPADEDPAASDNEHPAPHAGARSSVRGQRPLTTLERAAALLEGDKNEEPS